LQGLLANNGVDFAVANLMSITVKFLMKQYKNTKQTETETEIETVT